MTMPKVGDSVECLMISVSTGTILKQGQILTVSKVQDDKLLFEGDSSGWWYWNEQDFRIVSKV